MDYFNIRRETRWQQPTLFINDCVLSRRDTDAVMEWMITALNEIKRLESLIDESEKPAHDPDCIEYFAS